MAVEVLKSRGVPEERILFLNLIASPEGIRNFSTEFPKLRVVTAFVDEVSSTQCASRIEVHHADDDLGVGREEVCNHPPNRIRSSLLTPVPSYIVPGLGDFGDRFYTM